MPCRAYPGAYLRCRPCWQLDSLCLLSSTWTLEDVDDVEGLIASVVDRYLGRRGAYLSPDRREDLHVYLLGEVWRLYRKYDPAKASTPISLSTFLTRRLQWSVTNWYRETFGDSRYAASNAPELVSLEVVVDSGLEPTDSPIHVGLIPSLSDTGRGRWERFGAMRAVGFSYGEIAAATGVSTVRARDELEALGHELRSLS